MICETRIDRPFVLIAEDNDDDRQLLEYAFRRASLPADYSIVSDGSDVVQWLARKAPYQDPDRCPFPDLLVLDIKMPQKNGFEVLEWVRSQNAYERLPVVLMSGIRSKELVDRALAMGAHSYLFKPGDFSELVRFISDFAFLRSLQMQVS